jgi:hypothetical protein
VQESGSFQTTQKVPNKSDFFIKIGFIKACAQTYPRNPIFWKNRIYQSVCPNVPKKSYFLEKSDFSNRTQGAQEILFFGKIAFLKPCAQTCSRNPIFWKNRISFEMQQF